MIDFLNTLSTSYHTIADELDQWFSRFPEGAAWNIFSDYCIGDDNKSNDTFAFAVVLNHDTQANIEEYIAAVAPSDIKGSRSTSEGLIRYLMSPVVFSVTHIVDRQSKILRDYLTPEHLAETLSALRQIIALSFPRGENVYYREVDKRLAAYQQDMKRKSHNLGLTRQSHLCAAFAAMLIFQLDSKKSPHHIRWISDRDAMFNKFDGVTFDLAFLYFELLKKQAGRQSYYPEIQFGLPGWDGVNQFSEFIRIPDYLAGTAADLSLPSLEFTHQKFLPVFENVFVNAQNAAVIEVLGSKGKVTTRRVGFSAPIGLVVVGDITA